MPQTELIIGRKGDVRILHGTVSRQHARLQIQGDGYYLVDLGSSNGTYRITNGYKKAFSEGYVTPDEQISFGDYACTIRQLLETDNRQQGASGTGSGGTRPNPLDITPGPKIRCGNCARVIQATMTNCPHCGYQCG